MQFLLLIISKVGVSYIAMTFDIKKKKQVV